MLPGLGHALEAGDETVQSLRVRGGCEANRGIIDESVREARVRAASRGDRNEVHPIGNDTIKCMKENDDQRQPDRRRRTTALTCPEQGLKFRPGIVGFRDSIKRLHGILHEFQGLRMKTNGISRHAASASSEHTKCNNNPIITGRCIIVETSQIVFEDAA